jgi:glycosyltransferase involved in cell wall biosynthesis
LLVNPLKRYFATAMMRGAYAAAGHIVCVSEYTRRQLEKHMSARADIEVIPNGVNLKGIVLTHPHNQAPHFLFVGGVKLRKGVFEAVAAIAAYREKYGECRLDIIGSLIDERDYAERVRARVEKLSLKDVVTLHGSVARDELAGAYADADALIMLNVTDGKEFEGFGLVFLEANARGCPALGAVGTAAEAAIKAGKSGYLVEAGDAAGAASALHRIFNEGAALRDSARTWAEGHAWRAIASKYVAVYTTRI